MASAARRTASARDPVGVGPATAPAVATAVTARTGAIQRASELPTEQEREEALIEAIGQNIEERMSAGTLGEIGGMTIRTEPLSAQTQKMPEVPQEHHVATPRKFEDLKFGKNYNPNEN